MPIIVPAAGASPNPVLLVGEAPGETEARARPPEPFVGRAGAELDAYLAASGLSTRAFRRTNVVPLYTPGNPDPTPAQIDAWSSYLQNEISACAPRLIIAVGRFSMRWFLGEAATLDLCHGIPHRAGAFDPTRADRAPAGCIVVSTHHPAEGFYKQSARALIDFDFRRVADCYRKIMSGHAIPVTEDALAGLEDYRDVSGRELVQLLSGRDTLPYRALAIDTEGAPIGSPLDPWSIQVSDRPGVGYCLRVERDDFAEGIAHLRWLLYEQRVLALLHNFMYDAGNCRLMGLELGSTRVRIWDSMYALYTLCVESQRLKDAAWRWCGMRMTEYEETVGAVAREEQLAYLRRAAERGAGGGADAWPKAEPYEWTDNAGVTRTKRPKSISTRINSILGDYDKDKRNKDGEPVHLWRRWHDVERRLRRPVEDALGRMPQDSIRLLAKRNLKAAVDYGCRDADAGFRIWPVLVPELERNGTDGTMLEGMDTLPVFEQMKSTGLPLSRKRLVALDAVMCDAMARERERLSREYLDGAAINPKSPQHVAALMETRGLVGNERTKTGAVSTARTSIQHLAFEDDAMAAVFAFRRPQHIRDMYCRPLLTLLDAAEALEPSDGDLCTVRCDLNTTRTVTRRLASKKPNLLAIPKHENVLTHDDYGLQLRECFVCRSGYILTEHDLSQAEMRVAADLSGDPLMCRLFLEDRDVHKETASLMFGVPIEQLDKNKHRTPAKRIGFGILYGLQAHGLWIQLQTEGLVEWTEDRCREAIDEWLRIYKGIRDCIGRTGLDTYRSGVARTWSGMPRYLPGIRSRDKKTSAEAARMAFSMRVQGGAQDMIQRSMRWLRPRIERLQLAGVDIRWCLQYHDALLTVAREEGEWGNSWDVVDPLMTEALTQHYGPKLRVPVKADGKWGRSWGELH